MTSMKSKGKGGITCFRCRGRGHMAKGCSTPLEVAENINWGDRPGPNPLRRGGRARGLSNQTSSC